MVVVVAVNITMMVCMLVRLVTVGLPRAVCLVVVTVVVMGVMWVVMVMVVIIAGIM